MFYCQNVNRRTQHPNPRLGRFISPVVEVYDFAIEAVTLYPITMIANSDTIAVAIVLLVKTSRLTHAKDIRCQLIV